MFRQIVTDELLCDLSDLFKIFGDTTRVKILFALMESEMGVCCIAELLGMTQSAISHQLKTLKDANLVANRREGKTILYRLSDDHVRSIVAESPDSTPWSLDGEYAPGRERVEISIDHNALELMI